MEFVLQAVIAMAIAIVLGVIIFFIYRHYYGGVVYSSSFAVTLVGMTALTCMLTLAISSNIVISLGMVGALSIVRYRTAIKDPMDLLYIFWSISVGITVAANLYVLAAIAMVVMTLIVHVFYHRRKTGTIYIMVIHYSDELAENEIYKIIHTMKYQLKSKTIRKGVTEMTIEIMSRHNNTAFVNLISDIDGVNDATLIQYNGEYNG